MTDDLGFLPDSLRQVAEATTLAAALQLVSDFGGTEIYVPKNPKASSSLAKSIGIVQARRLAEQYGGESILIPVAEQHRFQHKLAKVREMLEQGMTVPQIARYFGNTMRTAYNLKRRIAGTDDDPDQPKLF